MVATFNVCFDYSGASYAPGIEKNVDPLGPPNLRFKTSDDSTIDSENTIPITAGETRRSFWKQVYLKCSSAPSQQVDNIKFYSEGGGLGTGITLNVGLQFPEKNSISSTGYRPAQGVLGDTGYEIVASHADISSKADAFSYVVGSPLSGPTISEDGNVIDAIGETTNYLVFQMDISGSASPGNLADKTLSLQYDEI